MSDTDKITRPDKKTIRKTIADYKIAAEKYNQITKIIDTLKKEIKEEYAALEDENPSGVKIYPLSTNPHDIKIVKNLHKLITLAEKIQQTTTYHDKFQSYYTDTLPIAEKGASGLAWAFSSKTKKNEILIACNVLNTTSISIQKYIELEDTIIEELKTDTLKDVWQNYSKNNASYIAHLEKIIDKKKKNDHTFGYSFSSETPQRDTQTRPTQNYSSSKPETTTESAPNPKPYEYFQFLKNDPYKTENQTQKSEKKENEDNTNDLPASWKRPANYSRYDTDQETPTWNKYKTSSGENQTSTYSYPNKSTTDSYLKTDTILTLENDVKNLLKEVSTEEINTDKLKAELILRPYQEDGVKFTIHQRKVLLGDEMGLGKTIQALGVMSHLASEGATHFLVVCPLSVLTNWGREVQRYSRFKVFSIYGKEIERNSVYKKWIEVGGVGITTYETLKNFTCNFSYSLLVVDEAHKAKNPDAQRTRSVREFGKFAKYILYMTGTPLENKVLDMLNLIEPLNETVYKSVYWLKRDKKCMSPMEFRLRIAPVYLRRLREDVLDQLPEKTEIDDWCPMSQSELERYKQSLARDHYMNIRRVSWNIADISQSNKAKKMIEICEDAKENQRKVIVFSYFKDTLKQIQTALGNTFTTFGPITGSVSNAERQKMIDDFTDAEPGCVLISQIVSGGEGVNIQAASVVIICEPQIKPSIENQAISRAYRMGQARDVFVHRLLSEGTIDEYMMQMLSGKIQEFNNYADKSSAGDAARELSMMTDFIHRDLEKYGVTRTLKADQGTKAC